MKTTGETEDVLNKQIQALSKRRDKLALARRIEENRNHLGKRFRIRNSYGGDRKPWWLYVRIDRLSPCGSLYGVKFQRTPSGETIIEADTFIGYWIDDAVGYSGAENVSAATWEKEVGKVISKAANELS